MSDIVLTAEKVSKSYLIGHNTAPAERYTALRDVIARNVRSLARKTRDMFHGRPIIQGDEVEEFLALQDVSFELGRGETLGIIGRNGAGKSTLLKVLSRITEPTKGRITLRGRIASLLEVGTGFHPELTGRENIFLNGAILGMKRGEIQRKFDEIVAFSEVGGFLDTPVKRYSSGMYVRLAFAVAAHLEPEILVVDEVLAVGDAAFQRKCLGKMGDVAKEGRTVLFVSHNMAAVQNLCQRGIMLRAGRVAASGPIQDVIEAYIKDIAGKGSESLETRTDRSGNGKIRVTSIQVLDRTLTPVGSVMTGDELTLRLHYRCLSEGRRECRAGILVYHLDTLCFVLSSWMSHADPIYVSGTGHIDFTIPSLPLAGGPFRLDAFLESSELYDWVMNGGELLVVEGDFFSTGRVKPSQYWKHVGVLVRHRCDHGVPIATNATVT